MHHKHFSQDKFVVSIEALAGAINFTSNDASVTFTINGNNIDFSATGGGGGTPYYAWSVVSISTTLASGHGYISNSASPVAFTLPAAASVGDHYKITGYGAGGWTLGQNSGQTIHFPTGNTTTGVGGSIASQNAKDGIEVICAVANTDFVVVDSYDTLTVT